MRKRSFYWLKNIALILLCSGLTASYALSAENAIIELKEAVHEAKDAAESEQETAKPAPSIQERMPTYEHYAQELRGLKFKRPVKYKHVRKNDVKGLLDKKLEEQYPEDEFNDKIEAYTKIGLLKSSEGIREMMLEMLTEQVAGFYDTDEQTLFTITDHGLDPQFDAMIYVHELTHVLQDQHFDIAQIGLYQEHNDDMAIAALALIEGDAILIMGQYFAVYGEFSFKLLKQAMSIDSSKLNSAPLALQRNLLFPYTEGISFVTEIHSRDGWDGVNEVFKDPPQSSEQIFHPEKYLDDPDEPTEIELPDLKKILGDQWRLLDNNVMGELNTQVLFQLYLGKWLSRRPSKGWDGDRYNVLKNTEDGSMLFIWSTVWDTQKDVDEFYSAYIRLIEKKYPNITFQKKEGPDTIQWKSDGLFVFAGKSGNSALVAECPTEELLITTIGTFSDFRTLGRESIEENK